EVTAAIGGGFRGRSPLTSRLLPPRSKPQGASPPETRGRARTPPLRARRARARLGDARRGARGEHGAPRGRALREADAPEHLEGPARLAAGQPRRVGEHADGAGRLLERGRDGGDAGPAERGRGAPEHGAEVAADVEPGAL